MDRSAHTSDEAREERYGLAELAEAAGVSVRTVRYYIAEGLLPPPEGGGARSSYRQGHLDRLRLIGRLKAAYLPLREIRHRLTGLDDAAARSLLEEPAAPYQDDAQAAAPDSAAAYLARLLPPAAPARPAPTMRSSFVGKPPTAPEQDVERRTDAREAVRLELDRGAALAEDPPLTPDPTAESWRRISLGPDLELLVREDTYQRRHDKIAWLIDWAKKVLQ